MLEFTVKVSNQSATRQTGTVRLTLGRCRTLESVDQQLGNRQRRAGVRHPGEGVAEFLLAAAGSRRLGFLTYKAVGSTGRLSDGEEGYLPVLSRRILVTESLPLPIRGAATKKFEFTKLLKSGESDTLRHQIADGADGLEPGVVRGDGAAVPDGVSVRVHASRRSTGSMPTPWPATSPTPIPKIRRIFDQWKGTPALDSPLEKNQDLKAVMLEETPWLRQARTKARRAATSGILFDDNRLNDETARGLRKLAEMQQADGAWPWFPGGRRNDYITLYITTGFGRLRHLGVDIDVAPAVRSLTRLDAWIDEQYREIVAHGPQGQEQPQPDHRALPVWPQLLPGRSADCARSTRRRSTTSSARRASTGSSWAAASRRPTWPSR